jgi:hypothetical protein
LELDLDLIKESLVEPIRKESELIKLIKQIKNNFTVERDKIDQYCLDQKMVSAYTTFYLTTNVPKFSFVFAQLSEKLKNLFQEYDFIDFGTGPGTYILAHHLQIPEFKGNYYGVDASELMLKQASKLLFKYGVNKESLSLSSEPPKDNSKKKILFFGNSLNEIGPSLFKRIRNELDPEIVFFLEPGTKESFNNILNVREELFQKDYHCHFPCPSGLTRCFMGNSDNWCHQVFRHIHDEETQRLCQLVQLDRNVMPLIAHVYCKALKRTSEKLEGFMVRRLKESKHSFKWQVCLDNIKYSGLFEVELHKKNFSKSELKKMKKISTGLKFNFQVEKQLGDKKLRISL